MRVIVSSAGRRVYLVRWFQQALREAGISGKVFVVDHDPRAAAAAAADGYRHMPAFSSAEYPQQLFQAVQELEPDLFVSLNDYELTALSQGLSEQLRAQGVTVPVLDSESHRSVADKLAMSRVLTNAGISTPKTVVLSDVATAQHLIHTSPRVIIKDRWGSGSSGLLKLPREEARRWVTSQLTNVFGKRTAPLDELIIQPDLGGVEYGLDIVTPVQGGPVEAVLARRKLSMRHGETAAAETVDSGPFLGLAAALNATLGIQGTIDVDVIMTADGVPYVIDINPRFGGGYPFSHLAGADVPHFFVASTLGLSPRPGWNSYRQNYVAAKHEGMIGFEPATEERQILQFQHESDFSQPTPVGVVNVPKS